MKNYLQTISIAFKTALTFFVLVSIASSLHAQCDTKITDTDGDKKDYVCAESSTYYEAVRNAASAGSNLDWNISGGGNITASSTDGVTDGITITWDSIPDSGPYYLTLTETNGGCSNTDVMEIYIEKANLTMACNPLVLVALDNNCRDTINGDQILEGPLYPNESYDVTIFNIDNSPRAEPIVTMADLGDTLMALVRHTCTGLACMGRLSFQDNLATMLSCRGIPIILECDQSEDPENALVGFPLTPGSTISKIDNRKYEVSIPGDCGGEFTLVYSDNITESPCGSNYQFVINRTWSAIDNSGNSWSCTEVIYKKWGDFDTMDLPPHYDGMNGRQFFQCNDPDPLPITPGLYWPYRDSVPGPQITGYPEYANCSNIQFLYEDLKLPVCGYSRKILRHWIILDWCTGRQKIYDQVLAFVDDTPPIAYLPNNILEYDAKTEKCYGSAYPLPAPTVTDCSLTSYEVLGFHFSRDGNCLPEESRKEGLFKDSNGNFGINNIPVDSVICISYKVTDECGLYSYSNVSVVIRDNEKPTAACDAHTVVTLGEYTKLTATALDNGSWDNCGIDKLQIRRTNGRCNYSDIKFGEYVEICCKDVGNDFTVILRAFDKHGKYSECTGKVHVDDKERPVLTFCPPNFEIDCEQNYSNYFPGGKPTATDNCGLIPPTKIDRESLNDCGFGTIRRTWTLKDKGGLETQHKCVQIITVKDGHPLSDNNITWPGTITLTGCWPNVDYDESITGIPTIGGNKTCKDLGIAHKDRIVQNPANEDACVIIYRTFSVGDWCQPNLPYIEHTQKILISDGGAPTFTYCKSDTTILSGASCSANVTLSALATDECTEDSKLKYSYKVDVDNDGSFEKSGSGNIVNYTFDRGIHKVIFSVTDGCGNTSTCNRIIRVRDSKPPTPLCLRKITTTLGTDGSVTIDAKKFNHGSIDNCTPSNMGQCGCDTELRFSFSENVNDKYRTYVCDSLINGVGKKFELKVYVTDLDGNSDFCIVNLNIMDSQDVCPDSPDPLVAVQGMIMDENLQGMEGFQVKGTSLDQTDEDIAETNVDGNYLLNNLGAYNKYEIEPVKTDNALDGLTTLDIVLIQKHILGIKKLNNPYKYLAADANDSKSVTAADILLLRKLILGKSNNFPSNKTWKFLKANSKFSNPNNPWYYDEKYITDSLFFEEDSLDFIAIKIGDINHSASVFQGSSNLMERSISKKFFSTNNTSFSANEIIPVDISIEESEIISGFQFTFEYNSDALELINIENKVLKLSKANTNIVENENGIVTFSWNNANGTQFYEDNTLFRLNFKARESGNLKESIKISSKLTKSEIYSEDLSQSELGLRFITDDVDMVKVYQNRPNPFSKETEILFNLPEDSDVNFKVYNTEGQVLITTHGHYSKGQNSISISSSDLKEYGLYIYELTTNNTTIVKRMVYLK